MTDLNKLIEKAQALLAEARYAVALTGAGISTPSGIPDFRSPTSGLWETYDPMEVASIYAFKQNPRKFYDWMRPLAKQLVSAKPNPAHVALSALEKHGPLEGIITQNIDVLHAKAGSQTIYEVHGHTREATCMGCGQTLQAEERLAHFVETGELPVCPSCNNILKPNVILFGELLPFQVYAAAERATEQCDLMLVAGSSLETSPVGDLPALARETGARLIFVNYSRTPYDHLAHVVIRDDVAKILPQLAAPFLP